MACCAFAAFVLTQLLAPFVWLRQRLFGAAVPVNHAVGWSPDRVTAAPAPRLRWARKTFVAAVALELTLTAAAIVYVAPRGEASAAWIEAQAFDGAWCHALIARIAARD
jgi:hypothetical protein